MLTCKGCVVFVLGELQHRLLQDDPQALLANLQMHTTFPWLIGHSIAQIHNVLTLIQLHMIVCKHKSQHAAAS